MVRKLGKGAFGDVLLGNTLMGPQAIKCVRLEEMEEARRRKLEGATLEETLTGYLAGVHQNMVSVQYFIPATMNTAGCHLIFINVLYTSSQTVAVVAAAY